MALLLLAYLGGMLTIFSPCVLPVLPFIFARPGMSFRRGGLPILLGMAGTFTILAVLAAWGGTWLVNINQYGRYVALLLLVVMGLALIVPSLSVRLMRPFANLGERLQQRAEQHQGITGSLLLGVAIGFLWAPCAGPILGLLLAGVALNGVNTLSIVLLLAFALGAATSLALALLVGGRIFTLMKQSLGAEEWVRRGVGVLVLAGAMVIALGWDTRFLANFNFLSTAAAEQQLIGYLEKDTTQSTGSASPRELKLQGATLWLNSRPLDGAMLQGKVVLVDFWTYSCINCLRTLPYLKAWDEKYRSKGLVIVGVHAPEFAFEKDRSNVEQAVQDLGIRYPVAMDNDYHIWNAFNNRYWPAHYLFDARGRLRHEHFGEGAYAETEHMIQELLQEAHPGGLALDRSTVKVAATGVMSSAAGKERSPETYVGYARQENLASPETMLRDATGAYSTPELLKPNQWALSGKWQVAAESATLQEAKGAISFRFYGRDLNLVLGVPTDKPVRFKVTLDGKMPQANRGADIDSNGDGVIRKQRLYQLIRLNREADMPHTFRIEFLDGGAEAFAFTFG